MFDFLNNGGEKKVEYIELIYDLIFVYIIGRNNTLLQTIENGFVAPSAFLTYILTALIILQIWYSTVIFINKYGANGLQENLAIFINMYLLYYMADGVRTDWQDYFYRFNIAWALILANQAVQYLIKYKKAGAFMPWVKAQIKRSIFVLLVQIAVILISLPLYRLTGIPFSPLAMVLGIILVSVGSRANELVAGDFAHLTERVMLYVVFTFGEMIIAIAEYFEGGFGFSTIYYSLCAFLIVAGLFLSYGFVYDNVINREMQAEGTGYMLLHIFMITALNNITAALEYMRTEEVAAIPKNVFIVASIITYFIFLFLTEKYAIVRCQGSKKFFAVIIAMSILFAAFEMLFFRNPLISIALTVVYIYSVFLYLYFNVKKVKKEAEE